MRHFLKLILITVIGFSFQPASAASHDKQIDAILAASEMPEGVVFEIISGDSSALQWAIPETKQAIDKLRQRFPELPIAVVSHGQEQFALQKKHKQQYEKVHSLTESLVKDSGVDFHVCGTYAEMHGIAAEEFAEFADVAAAGPAQINDYVKLGYIKILISRDTQD